MLGMFNSKARGVQVGVDFMPTGVAVVGVSTAEKSLGQVHYSAFLPSVGVLEQSKVLQDWVDRHDLKKAPCVSLIAKHDVQMFQLEKPAVEDEEMLQAISWKLKDLRPTSAASPPIQPSAGLMTHCWIPSCSARTTLAASSRARWPTSPY